jgi:hypothetical protein
VKQKKSRDTYTRVGNVLEGYLARHPRMQYEVKVKEAVRSWPLLVDEYVRLHTEAIMVKDRMLYVHTDSPALASELTLREKEFRARLNRALNMELLQRIVFRSGRVSPGGQRKETVGDIAPSLTTAHVKKIEAAVQNIREDELREIMKRLLREMAKRGRKRS